MNAVAPLLTCRRCKHKSPDQPGEIDNCPGCGANFVTGAVAQEVRMENVVAFKKDTTPAAEAPAGTPAGGKKRAVKATETSPTKAAEAGAAKMLATLETRIDDLRKQGARVEWELGTALASIRQNELWRQAELTGEDKPGSFADYCQKRFGFVRQTAENYIRIATTFTPEQADKLGPSVLALIAKVPADGDRTKLIKEAMEKSLSRAQVAEKVKKLRDQAGMDTTRKGFEGKVRVAAWLEPGDIAEGEWRDVRGKRTASFNLGGQVLDLVDLGPKGGFKVKLRKPAAG